ncbi:MAG: UDP-N-acetylmuramate dehydrogenase [Clostridiales bacterium]|nr:UDP-N-acetylmuramate dehydrogenase [Clostridiales bacterium]
MNIEEIKRKLLPYIDEDRVLEHEPMDIHTSFRCGGSADLYVVPANIAELFSVRELLLKEGMPHIIMGNGSNLLFLDGGYRGVVVKLGEGIDRVRFEGNIVFAEPGVGLAALSRQAMKEGRSGLEFACGIPGSLGGAVYMNAGAYGGSISDLVVSVASLNSYGIMQDRKAEDCEFGYRNSIFAKNEEMIVGIKLQLGEDLPARIEERMVELTERRNAKQPVNMPSAGSFFKRPEGDFAGRLIEEAGLKGLRVGGAMVSPLHAGFIVNAGGATTRDVIDLMTIVRETVAERSGIVLEPEVQIVGEE